MGGVGGVANAKVVVLGAGVAGQNAANIALGMGADVTMLDTDLDKLRMSFWRYDNRVRQIASSALSVREQVLAADMVIGTVLIPGAKAPKARHRRDGRADEARLGARRRRHRPGRLLRGEPADHARRPDVHGPQLHLLLRRQYARRRPQHLHLGPDQCDLAVCRTLADSRLARRLPGRPALAKGLNTHAGQVTCPGVAEAFDLP
jgi:alanine dehydrogenase